MKFQSKRFYSQSSETAQISPFPHRHLRKDTPNVGSKMIPVHKLDIHRGYNGNTNDLTTFDHWAYVPMRMTKKSLEKMYTNLLQKAKQNPFKDHEKSIARSQLALKQYLKRKNSRTKKESIYFSQIINFKEKQSILQRIQREKYCLTQISQEYQSKKQLFKQRLKKSWEGKKDKMIESYYDRCEKEQNEEKKDGQDKTLFELISTKYDHYHRKNHTKSFNIKNNSRKEKSLVFFSQPQNTEDFQIFAE